MKTIFLLPVLLFLISSCEKETNQLAAFEVGDEVVFKLGESVQAQKNRVVLKITGINDSRCPSDVVCVWQGEARVYFEFDNNGKNALLLTTLLHPKDTVGDYIFTLLDVSPYPVSTRTVPLEDYKVKVKIEKL